MTDYLLGLVMGGTVAIVSMVVSALFRGWLDRRYR